MFVDLVRMLLLINHVCAKTKAQVGGVSHIVVLVLRTDVLFVFCNNVCKKPLFSTGVYKYSIFHNVKNNGIAINVSVLFVVNSRRCASNCDPKSKNWNTLVNFFNTHEGRN